MNGEEKGRIYNAKGKQGGGGTSLSLASSPVDAAILIPGTFCCSPAQPSFEILVWCRVPFSSRCSSFLAPVQLFVLPSPPSTQWREEEKNRKKTKLRRFTDGATSLTAAPPALPAAPHTLTAYSQSNHSANINLLPPPQHPVHSLLPLPTTPFHRFLLCIPLNFPSQALQPSTHTPFSFIHSLPTSSHHICKRNRAMVANALASSQSGEPLHPQHT